MKIYHLFGIILLALLTLTACSSTLQSCYTPRPQHDLLKETWTKQVNTNPNIWKKNADLWFLTGNPNKIEQYDNHAPSYDAMSTMNVRVPNFTRIVANGNFHIQLIGYQEHNSVYIIGPNQQIRQIKVDSHSHTLYLTQVQDHSRGASSVCKVIVRIGLRNLHNLTVGGSIHVEGRNVESNHLSISAFGRSNVLLDGNMNLSCVNQSSMGTITVMGAYTPSLRINVFGNGNVNVSGQVGVQSINHNGDGTINIIGANTNCLTINATGCGLTSISGYTNLKWIHATDESWVYLYWVNSNHTTVSAHKKARIGLAGTVCNLNVETFDEARFDGGYLHGQNVYVHTYDYSHANVESDAKLFANAANNSSIYFLGSPTAVSRFNSSQGSILAIGNGAPPCPTNKISETEY